MKIINEKDWINYHDIIKNIDEIRGYKMHCAPEDPFINKLKEKLLVLKRSENYNIVTNKNVQENN